jgi:hypothetical protein
MISKLLKITTAAAMVLSLGGLARAADETDQNTPQPQTRPQVPQTTEDPAAGGATATQAYQEYLVSLKKCEPLNGEEREKCVDAARRQHGQM